MYLDNQNLLKGVLVHFKLRILALVLGILLALFCFKSAQADDPEDDFVFDFAHYSSARNWQCHPDGWGLRYGDQSLCAQDFHSACGEPVIAPFSGTLKNIGYDSYGNTAAILDGRRYTLFMLHGDFPDTGLEGLPTKQGETVIGKQNTHGNSEGCHWHWTLRDKLKNVWVNPLDVVSQKPVVQTATQKGNTSFSPEKVQPYGETSFTPEFHDPNSNLATEFSQLQIWEKVYVAITPYRQYIFAFLAVLAVLFVVGLAISAEFRREILLSCVLLTLIVGIYFVIPYIFPDISVSAQSLSTSFFVQAPQAESTSFTPDLSQNRSSLNSGDCTLSPRWPSVIQQWCSGITQYAVAYGVNPDRYAALVYQESRGNPEAISNTCAFGLGQVMPKDGKGFIKTAADGSQYFECDLINGTTEAYQTFYANGSGGYYFQNRCTIADMRNDPLYGLECGVAIYSGYLHSHNDSDWDALYSYGGPGYGDRYKTIVNSNYECVLNNKLCETASPGLTSEILR